MIIVSGRIYFAGAVTGEGDKLLSRFNCGDLGADEQLIQLDGGELDRWQSVELSQLDSR